jgi:hypothetical protein
MKTNPQPKKNLSRADAERALNDTLLLGASIFPHNADDIEALEAETDSTSAPTPDVNKFRKLLAGGTSLKPTPKTNIVSFEIPEISENWAMAARNGEEITPEVRAKMDASRAAAKDTKLSS